MMDNKNHIPQRELQEINIKVNAFHKDKDRTKTELIKRGYFNALCPSVVEKLKFYDIYKEKYPEDLETLKMIEAELQRARERYPKDVAEMAGTIAEDLTKLAEKATKQMIENIHTTQKQINTRHVAMSDNVYFNDKQKVDKLTKAEKETTARKGFGWLFGWFGKNGRKCGLKVEKLDAKTIAETRQSMQTNVGVDARLAKYNASVAQRAAQSASKSAAAPVNASVMSR